MQILDGLAEALDSSNECLVLLAERTLLFADWVMRANLAFRQAHHIGVRMEIVGWAHRRTFLALRSRGCLSGLREIAAASAESASYRLSPSYRGVKLSWEWMGVAEEMAFGTSAGRSGLHSILLLNSLLFHNHSFHFMHFFYCLCR